MSLVSHLIEKHSENRRKELCADGLSCLLIGYIFLSRRYKQQMTYGKKIGEDDWYYLCQGLL